jgi:O-antigen/teichoic acid export membrane protein
VNLGRKLSTDILVTTIFDFATRIRGIVFIPIITGILGVSAYGAYSQLLAVTSLLAVISELGLAGSVVRYAQEDGDTAELYYSLTTFTVGVGICVTVVLYVVAVPLSRLTLGGAEYAGVFRIGAVLVPLRIWGKLAGSYFRSQMQIKFFSGFKTARAYLSILGVLVVLLVLDYGLSSVIAIVVGAELLYVLFLQSLVTRRLGITRPSINNLIKYLRYSVPLMASTVTSNISSRADRILIGFFLGSGAVGIYSISYQLATSLTLFIEPIRTTFFPEFSRLIEENRIGECLKYHKQGVRYYVGLALPAIGGLFLIGPEIVQQLASTTASEPSVVLLPIIGCGIFISGLDKIYGVLLVASERTALLTLLRGIAAVVNIILNLILIPPLGIAGAAAATAATYGLGFVLLYHKLTSIFPVPFDYSFLIKSITSSVIMVTIIYQIGLENIFLTLLVAPICYFFILYVFNGYTISEVAKFIPSC